MQVNKYIFNINLLSEVGLELYHLRAISFQLQGTMFFSKLTAFIEVLTEHSTPVKFKPVNVMQR